MTEKRVRWLFILIVVLLPGLLQFCHSRPLAPTGLKVACIFCLPPE